jgi:hypothetical protein
MFRIIHDVDTGEITQIELTPEEIAENENNLAAVAQIEKERQEVLSARAAKKAELLAKLGITQEEAALLLGGN